MLEGVSAEVRATVLDDGVRGVACTLDMQKLKKLSSMTGAMEHLR